MRGRARQAAEITGQFEEPLMQSALSVRETKGGIMKNLICPPFAGRKS